MNRGLLNRLAAYGPLLLSLIWLAGFPFFPPVQYTVVNAQTDAKGLELEQLEPEQDEWRRTVNGWEKKTAWSRPTKLLPAATRLHPVLLASIQILISVGSLLAFSNLDSSTVSRRSSHAEQPAKKPIGQAFGKEPSEKSS